MNTRDLLRDQDANSREKLSPLDRIFWTQESVRPFTEPEMADSLHRSLHLDSALDDDASSSLDLFKIASCSWTIISLWSASPWILLSALSALASLPLYNSHRAANCQFQASRGRD